MENNLQTTMHKKTVSREHVKEKSWFIYKPNIFFVTEPSYVNGVLVKIC
jgi:hypothetical protein